MGIQGLIPFLEKTSRPINISEFSGCTVAIDAYCWLHKGAFSCAEKLARGEKCDAYVYYCMKYIHMLLSHNIKPIMVFDGQHLPAKADTEKKRRENRELNRRRAAELLRQDKPNEARSFIRRCVDITHNMALELMHACRAANVDCVTAPYEADAQLAYLNLTGVAHLVITEDSDLILFGCKKVVFKLDPNGGGLLVDQDKLHLSMKCRPENYSFEKFRRMCILSGCDYLPSLPGIGLSKACRFITRTMDPDIERALPRMSSYLNMPQLVVTKEYIENFVHAEAMFKHQPVFDTMQRKVMPLTPIDDSTPKLRLPQPLPEDEAYQLALGNLDPFTLKVVADWNPDQRQDVKKKWGTTKQSNHPSIWEVNFQITEPKFRPVKAKPPPSTAGKQIIQDPKIEFETSNLIDDKDFENILFDEEMNTVTQPAKKVCLSKESEAVGVDNGMEVEGEEDESRKSPILLGKINAKSKFFNKLKKQRNTVVDEKVKVQSRYFNSSSPILRTSASSANSTPVGSDKDTLKDISNVDELTRRSSPKKLDENILTTQISPTRKSRETPLSPGKRVVTVSSSLFTELSMEENEVKDGKSCGKAASPRKLTKKSVTIRSSLFTEHSMEESEVKDTDKDRDNDSGVSCPNSFELDNVEECSQSSAKSVSSISTFTWKQKFHEKFGFKSNSGAEKVLQSSKAVNSGFQSPFSRKNADNSVNMPQTPRGMALMTKVLPPTNLILEHLKRHSEFLVGFKLQPQAKLRMKMKDLKHL
ncbi:exonuclease 1 [Nilaparvata lugens]|uniref:exonuclease 1 n=1 Tax=Nilaparvata lugens TaxID=108931 RepID=UPI00193EAE20|nr:exonuclease 1 [Nilaparvata lugens]